jgi:hypothetical protein
MNGRRRASSATTSLAGALSPIAPWMHGASDCLRPGALPERLHPNRMIAKEDSQCGRSD